MNILLTNDDGIEAAGIRALYDALSEHHAVFIVAPRIERSACSNAITVRDSIAVERIAPGRFAISGFTSDCVNIGINGDIIPGVDLVISGINHGPNLGDDVYFSGTVAGARTAHIFGKPGIAVSLDCLGSSDYFGEAASFVSAFVRDNWRHLHAMNCFLNINYPDLPVREIKGTSYTTLGRRKYQDSYRIIDERHDFLEMQIEGTIVSDHKPGTDVAEVRNGLISITPLKLDATDYEFLSHIRR